MIIKHYITLLYLLIFTFCYSQQNKSISFNVDNVTTPETLLNTFPLKKIIENSLNKKVVYFPESQQNLKSLSVWHNGLIQTIHYAFDQHRPLILTPDVIWLAICQGTSIHINENYNDLKNDLFTSAKQSELFIRNDNLVYGKENWAVLIDSMAIKTKQYTKKDFYNLFVPEFSTTNNVNKMAYQITLLETFKKRFNYVGGSGCGIPTITLKGTKQDWELIYKKLNKLSDIGLQNWSNALKPIIKEFINCYDGNINTLFWQDIYKNKNEYGGFYISGWIINFFPYIQYTFYPEYNDENLDDYAGVFKYKKNEFMGDKNYLLSTITMGDLPDGIADINLLWDNMFNNTKTNYVLYAGFFGVQQNKDFSLEPIVSWALCKKNAKPIEKQYYRSVNEKVPHNSTKFWHPKIVKQPTKKAIYDIKRYKTYENAMHYLKADLKNKLKANPETKNINLSIYKFRIIVLNDGSIGKVELTNEYNEKLEEFLINYFKNLNKNWFPALTNVNKISFGYPHNKNSNVLVKVNSYVYFEF